MAVNPKRRQRKLEKKRAERKAEKKLIARRQSQSIAAKFLEAGTGRVLHCEFSMSLWSAGIGHVWIGRELRGGLVGFTGILVDVYCLGVKDVFGKVCSRQEYTNRYAAFSEKMETEKVSIECARKLVEGAIAYAAEADLRPHPDYAPFALIFGDADASLCSREFAYGQGGKPMFASGPYDTPERCREVLDKLNRRYGKDGFHYMTGIGSSTGGLLPIDGEEYLEEEDLDDEYLDDDEDEGDGEVIGYLPPR